MESCVFVEPTSEVDGEERKEFSPLIVDFVGAVKILPRTRLLLGT